jgi:glutathione S-transferase
VAPIYHIAFVADWHQAQADGLYAVSTRGRTLTEEGFLHASTADQVALVANAAYADVDDLVVLRIEVNRLKSNVIYEYVPGSADPFPHIYGPLNADAVVAVLPLHRDANGRFTFTDPG